MARTTTYSLLEGKKQVKKICIYYKKINIKKKFLEKGIGFPA